jgi:DNA-binding NarL/FixJ family response regulator
MTGDSLPMTIPPTRREQIRLMVVDDQPLLRTGFRMILAAERDMTVVGEARDGVEAVREVTRLRPDVVLMDIRMPHMDGVEATRRITASAGPDGPRVLILTTFDLDEYVFAAIRAGASGFLLKDVPPEELAAAIRIVAAGEALLAPTVTRRLLDRFAELPPPAGGSTRQPPGFSDLTERELEVFTLIGRGLSNGEIAEKLVLGETTVKTHVSRVFAKLDLRDRVQAVVLAYETGVVRPGQAEG